MFTKIKLHGKQALIITKGYNQGYYFEIVLLQIQSNRPSKNTGSGFRKIIGEY